MPRIVDHDQRRSELADAARVIVAREGIDALTIARVATVTGYSTGVVNHYFSNKRQMLLHTYVSTVERARNRLEPLLAGSPPELDACLRAFLPINEAQRDEWLLWFAFWGLAITDERFESEQRSRLLDAQEMFRMVFAGLVEHQSLPQDADVDFLAQHCVTLINGVAVQAVFDLEKWGSERQCDTVTRALALR